MRQMAVHAAPVREIIMSCSTKATCKLWNKGKIIELAFFNLGFDSKLRGRDLVGLRVRDLCHSSQVAHRAIVIERKTHRPVQFEITQIYQRKPRILDEGGRT